MIQMLETFAHNNLLTSTRRQLPLIKHLLCQIFYKHFQYCSSYLLNVSNHPKFEWLQTIIILLSLVVYVGQKFGRSGLGDLAQGLLHSCSQKVSEARSPRAGAESGGVLGLEHLGADQHLSLHLVLITWWLQGSWSAHMEAGFPPEPPLPSKCSKKKDKMQLMSSTQRLS